MTSACDHLYPASMLMTDWLTLLTVWLAFWCMVHLKLGKSLEALVQTGLNIGLALAVILLGPILLLLLAAAAYAIVADEPG